MPRLVVNPDTPEAWPIELEPGTILLGRGEQNDVPIEHPSVSASHCSITVSADGAWLKDLGSTAGTFVNDEIVEEARLKPGQTLRLGEVAIRFESDAPPESPASVAPPLAPRLALKRQPPKPQAGFAKSLPGALLYPLQGSGVIMLIAGTAFFYVLSRLPLLGLIVTGYLFAYAKSIITSTAAGRKDPPDWPDFGDWKDDILMPYLQLTALVLLYFGPAFVIGLWQPGTVATARIAYFTALGFGALFAPMAMLALAMFDTVAALNPIPLAWSILRLPLHYLAAAVAFGTGVLLYWFAEDAIQGLLPVPFVPELISSFLNLYFIAVGMRILGLLYVNNQDKFGWFSSRLRTSRR